MKMARLYSILRSLDAEMQMMGVRGDYGWINSPSFALDTLFACVCFFARLEKDPSLTLTQFAKKILEVKRDGNV